MTIRLSAAALALVLCASTPALATTLVAGPLRVGVGGQLVCAILNVGTKDVPNVSVDATLETVGSANGAEPVLVPGDTVTIGAANAGAASLGGWCTFTFKGPKKNVRASACVRATSATSASCAASLPAQ